MFAVAFGHVVVNNRVGSMNGSVRQIPFLLPIMGFFDIKFRWSNVIKLLGICYASYWLAISLRGVGVNVVDLILTRGELFSTFNVAMMLTAVVWNVATEQRKYDLVIIIMISVLTILAERLWLRTSWCLSLKGRK